MNINAAPSKYDQHDERQFRDEVKRADDLNFKARQDLRLQNGERVVLVSPNGTLFALSVNNAGALSTVSYP